MSAEQLKFCKDCRHYGARGPGIDRCLAAPLRPLVDVVSGADVNKGEYAFCVLARFYDGQCGEEARLFDPRPPGFLKRLWNSLYIAGEKK